MKKAFLLFVLIIASCAVQTLAQNEKRLVNHFGPEEGLLVPGVNCLAQDSRGFIWIGATSGLTRFDGAHFRTFPMPKGGEGSFVFSPRSMDVDRNDCIWIGTKRGLYCFDIQTETFSQFDKTQISDVTYVRSVITDNDGMIWATTDSAYYRIDPKTKSCEKKKESKTALSIQEIRHNQRNKLEHIVRQAGVSNVTAQLKDADGGLWIGTFFDGLFYIHPDISPFTTITASQKENDLLIVRQISSCGNNIYVGTENAGLYILTQDTAKQCRLKNLPLAWNGTNISNNIQAVVSVDGSLWIGTGWQGIYVLDPSTSKLTHHYHSADGASGLANNNIVCILQTRCGDVMVGTSQGLMIKRKTENHFTTIAGLKHGVVHAITETEDGNVWVGSLEGPMKRLKREKNGLWKATNAGFAHQCITAISTDQNGDLWIGTDCKGVWKMHGEGKFQPTDLSYEILHSSANTLAPDNDGNLWISTSNGLFYYDIEHRNIQHFTAALDGIPTNQMNFFSAYMEHDGSLYMGTYRGLVKFHPSQVKQPQVLVKPYFTNIRIGDKDTLAISNLTLDYNAPSIRIDYGVPDYSRTKNIWYRYKLEGASQNNWTVVKSGEQSIYISHLSPGRYKIVLQASKYPNKWEETAQTEMQIIVTPPFWSSSWGILLYISIFIIIVCLLLSLWRQRIERQNLSKQVALLLQNKELMRNTPKASPYDLIKDIATNKTENLLMEKIDNFLEQNCNNPQLQVELIAEHMQISKSTLYRKMKEFTSLSPNEYIRLFKLKRAARMLREDGMSIREVSEALCFSSVSYFTNSFSQQFGITPGEYKKG